MLALEGAKLSAKRNNAIFANVNLLAASLFKREHAARSRLRSLYMNVVVCPSVCRLSVTFVRPTQAIEIFGNVLRYLVRWPSVDIQVKFYGDRNGATPPSGGGR